MTSETTELVRTIEVLHKKVGQMRKALVNLRRNNEGSSPPCWCPPGGYVFVHGHCDACLECSAAVE